MAARLKLAIVLGDGGTLEARLENAGEAIAAGYKLCLSLVAPGEARAGCKLHYRHGGYMELVPAQEHKLDKGASWQFSFGYRASRHRPLNHSWLPARPYLACGNKTVPVKVEFDPGASEVTAARPAPVALELKLVPTPQGYEADGSGVCKLATGLAVSSKLPSRLGRIVAAVHELGRRSGLARLFGGAGNELELKLEEELAGGRHQLKLAKGKVAVTAGDDASLRHGLISLLQLAATHPDGVPCGVIDDAPRFGWRGMHLDCARHYYSVASICRLLDLMALLKFNRFHWHLIDDEAFRLELDSFPQLAAKTALRGPGCLVPGVFGAGAEPVGGSYSKADVAAVLAHAGELGIEVMPEIEIPAHAWALLQVLPGMRDPEDASGEESVQGYRDNTLNPAMPATWDFLEEALPEVVATFPFGVIHLGCDELPPQVWSASPALEQYKARHKLEVEPVSGLMRQQLLQLHRQFLRCRPGQFAKQCSILQENLPDSR